MRVASLIPPRVARMSYWLIHTLPSGIRDAHHADTCVVSRIETQLVRGIVNDPEREHPMAPSFSVQKNGS